MSQNVYGRYSKQVLFRSIGLEGQARIASSSVAVVGVGALGTVIAGQLARAGVGRLKLIDRDFVELSNLQRQTLFDEEDARRRLPKAVAAAEKLRAINSEIVVEPHIVDVTANNIEEVLAGCQLVLDGTDNLETRFLINDACVKAGIPWVYGGALGAAGMSMTVVPGKTPCLRCFIGEAPAPGTMPSCDTEGVLAAVTGVVASIECAESLRLLVGLEPKQSIVFVDVWEREYSEFRIERRPDCPACGEGRYEYLAGQRTAWTTVLCGRNAVQIVPPDEWHLSLDDLQARLSRVGRVTNNGFLLSVEVEGCEMVLFPNGRAIIKGTADEAQARTLYARYVGT
jgi:molybdopterin-synthase adenylyltransferase